MSIAHREGLAGLYRGFVPKLLRLGPGGGVLLLAFEFCNDQMRSALDRGA